jgi:hypothetical protein
VHRQQAAGVQQVVRHAVKNRVQREKSPPAGT